MLEQLIIAAIVLAAATFIGRRIWLAIAAARTPKGGGCNSGCGCAPTSPAPGKSP